MRNSFLGKVPHNSELNNYPEKVRMPAPEFSEHTEEVLLENGFTWEEIAQFKEKM